MNLPTGWNEISTEQFIKVARVLSSGEPSFHGKIKLLWILSDLPARKFVKIPIEETSSRFDQINWVTELIIEKAFFPHLNWFFKKHNGPKDLLQRLTLNQFIYADLHLSNFLSSKDIKELDLLIACLFNNKFDPETYETHAKKFQRLHINSKQAILVNFTGMRTAFAQLYPACFNKSEEKGGIPSVLNPWDKLKDELSGPKFGTISEVGSCDLHDIFAHLQHNLEKAAQAEIDKMAG
jgi:hypothetical protein